MHLVTLLFGALLLSSQKTLCVTHVSGMNCHPSLRKGTSSGLLAHSRKLSFGLSAHSSAADNGAAPRDDTETCAHAPARAGCSGRRPSVPRQGERRNYSASSSRHA